MTAISGSATIATIAALHTKCRNPAEICRRAAEINPANLQGAKRVGVTAGASTPNWLIEQVVKRLREIGESSLS